MALRAPLAAEVSAPERRPVPFHGAAGLALTPISPGDAWGPPWTTTWFRLRGTVPAGWSGRRVQAAVDLGFGPGAGRHAEGLVMAADGSVLSAVTHAHHLVSVLAQARGGEPVELWVAASSNPFTGPDWWSFEPTPAGHPATAGSEPLNRLGALDLVVVDDAADGLAHDLDVLLELAEDLPAGEPRRHDILGALERAMAAFDRGRPPAAEEARRRLDGVLGRSAAASAHQVTAVGHAHLDTAWLWPVEETRGKAVRTFANAAALLDADPDARFVASQALHYAWVAEDEPALFARVVAHVQAGRWAPAGGMWVETDVNLPDGESWVRQLVTGQRWFERHLGRRCEELWLPDDFGFPPALPGVASQAGLRWFFSQKLSWNETNTFPHHLFWWEGLDGTRLFSHFSPADDYNTQLRPAALRAADGRFSQCNDATRWLVAFGHGDGGGGPSPDMVERARRQFDLEGVPRLSFGLPAEFFAAAQAEYGEEAPVWVGELYLETHRGTFSSQRRTKQGNRGCERLLREAELWCVLAGGTSADGDLTTAWPVGELDGWWRDVLVQQFHDILPGSSIAWVHEQAEATHARVTAGLEELIVGTLAGLGDGHGGLLAANATTAAVDEVTVCARPDWLGEGEAWCSGPEGAPHPVQHLAGGRVALRVAAPALGTAGVALRRAGTRAAPLGPRRVVPVEVEVEVGPDWMANGLVRIGWDETGCLTSIVDLVQERELVPRGRRANVLTLHPDHPARYDAWDVDEPDHRHGEPLLAPAAVEVVEAGPLIAATRVARSIGRSTILQTVSLRAGSGRVDLGCEVDWCEDERMLRVEIPLDVHAATARAGVQFGHVDRPRHAGTSWDAARFETCVHRYLEVAEHGYRVAVLVDGSCGADAGGGAVRLTLLRSSRFPDPAADRGRHQIRWAVLPIAGRDRSASVVEDEADRFATPPRLVDLGPPGVHPAPARTAITVEPGGVGVSAVKVADDGSGDLVVRLWERDGGRVRCRLGSARPLLSAWLADLLEDPHTPLPIHDGSALVELRPHRVVTVRARLA